MAKDIEAMISDRADTAAPLPRRPGPDQKFVEALAHSKTRRIICAGSLARRLRHEPPASMQPNGLRLAGHLRSLARPSASSANLHLSAATSSHASLSSAPPPPPPSDGILLPSREICRSRLLYRCAFRGQNAHQSRRRRKSAEFPERTAPGKLNPFPNPHTGPPSP